MDDMMLGYVLGKSQGGGVTPSGSVEITENGTYDVTEFATAEVDVAGSDIKVTKYGFAYNTGEWKNTDYGVIALYPLGGNYSPFAFTSGITKITIDGTFALECNYAMSNCPASITEFDATNAVCTSTANFEFAGSKFTKMIFGENWTHMGNSWWNASNPNAEIHFYGVLNKIELSNYGASNSTTEWYLHSTTGVIPLSSASNIRAGQKIHIPASLYDDYCAATNWSAITDQIVGDL